MDEMYMRFDGVFFERTRLSILSLLFREGSASFKSLKDRLRGTDGSTYAHLEKLLQVGYIAKKRRIAGAAVQTTYTLTRKGNAAFKQYILFLEGVLNGHIGGRRGER